MKNKMTFAILVLAAVSLGMSANAFAKGGNGKGQKLRDGSCLTTSTATTTVSAAQSLNQQQSGGTQNKKMRKLGAADGSGLAPQPLDGTGYGSAAQ